MKRLLEALLIVLALTLCGLCAVQWNREHHIRNTVEELRDDQKKKAEKLDNLTAANARLDEQVNALIQKTTEIENANREQNRKAADTAQKLSRAETQNASLTNAVTQLREAVEDRNNKIREANERIHTVNAERVDLAKKSNEMVAKSNEIVKKYNELVDSFEKMQSNYMVLKSAVEQPKK
jgi:chromosome segregation ATPase